MTTPQDRLNQILPSWYDLLTQWSLDGSLVAAASDALMLESSNAKQDAKGQLQAYASQWSAGHFQNLPQFVLLSAADISGAYGAYADSTASIYLNQDWLLGASAEDVQKVLTHELGHYLDDQLNKGDTQGDEGQLFEELLIRAFQANSRQAEWTIGASDEGTATVNGSQIAVEQSSFISSAIPASQPLKTKGEFNNIFGFAALKGDGSVVTWGGTTLGGQEPALLTSGVTQIFSNQFAFAALRTDGSVVTFGNADIVVDSSRVASSLSSGISKVFSNAFSFAALKNDGSVVTWGLPVYGVDNGRDTSGLSTILGSGVTEIFSTSGAFAALKTDGSVVTWGDSGQGGNSSGVVDMISSGVRQVTSSYMAFAALKSDGSVVTWGHPLQGGDSSGVAEKLRSGVDHVFANGAAFAALKSDGSVVTWGDPEFGSDSTKVASDLSSGVTKIYSSLSAFAALKADGSVITWGSSGGGDSSAASRMLENGVVEVFSNSNAFAALKSDGSLVTWGNPGYGGDSSNVSDLLSSGVVKVLSNSNAFAALKADGSVVTWGYPSWGGDSSSVSELLSSGVTEIVSNERAFAALKADGSVVTWGDYLYGGNNTGGTEQLYNVVGFANPFTDDYLAIKEGLSFSPISCSSPSSFVEGATLTAGAVVDPDNINGLVTYKWYKGSTEVQSGPSDTFIVGAQDRGTYWVRAVYKDGTGNLNNVSSATQIIEKTDNGLGTVDSISSSLPGIFQEGVLLTAGRIKDDPDGNGTVQGYQWYINDIAITTNGTSAFYDTSATGYGSYSVEVSYIDSQDYYTSVKSAAVDVAKSDNGEGILSAITSSNPDSFQEGVRLTAGSINGDPDGNGTITGYQWYFNDAAITTNGTSSFYDVSNTGHGNYKVAVTYNDGQDYVTTLTTSNQVVSKFDNGNAAVSITGTSTVGTTLTSSITTPDPDGDGSFTYQWQSLDGSTWSNIASATASTYQLTSNELTKQVRVVVTSTDAQGYGPITLYSNTTVPVVTPPDSTPPTITDISVQGNNVILTFSEKVNSTGINNSTFVVRVGGTARSVSATSYDSTYQNKVTLTLSGTAPASSTTLQVSYSGTNSNVVKDLAGNSLGTFTNRSADSFLSSVSVTSLYADYTNLTLTGSTAINGTGNAKNNTIIGNQANNTLNGAVGADVLTGAGGTDTFVYTTLANSLLGTPSNYTFDRITDFAIGQDKIDGPKTASTSQVQELGTVTTLDQAGLQAILTTTRFTANGAASFTYNDNGTPRTFVALNNNVAGFDGTKDAVVEITGYSGLLTNLAIV